MTDLELSLKSLIRFRRFLNENIGVENTNLALLIQHREHIKHGGTLRRAEQESLELLISLIINNIGSYQSILKTVTSEIEKKEDAIL